MALQDDFNGASDEWFGVTKESFPLLPQPEGGAIMAVRAPVALPVLDTQGFQKRREAVKTALVILSQSPTARKFADIAIREGYRIDVDPPVISGAGAEFDDATFGSTDHANKRINLKGCDDPLRMAFILAHELTHVSQIVEGGLDMRVSALHPLAAIRQLMAMEGDARAHEFLFAVELSQRAADDPDERLLFPQALDVAAETIGVKFGARVIDAAKEALAKGDTPQEWMARIFKCLYATPGLRMHYEHTILNAIGTLERENPGTLKDATLFTGEMPVEDIVARLGRHGAAYLPKALAFIDFADPRMTSLSPETLQALAVFESLRHENPQTLNDAPWQAQPYQPLRGSPPQPSTPRPPAP